MTRTTKRIYLFFGIFGGIVAAFITYQLVLNRLDLPNSTLDFTIFISSLSLSIFFVPVGIATGLCAALLLRMAWSWSKFRFGEPDSG